MMKPLFDQDALIDMFAKATAKQGESLRTAVSSATLKALQSREVTLDGVRKAVSAVAGAATSGAARNPAPAVDVEKMLGSALAGIDSALLQAVEANRKAMDAFMNRGSSLADKPMQDALATVEKMEDAFFAALGKAGKSAGTLQTPWDKALATFKAQGSSSGAQAEQMVESFAEQAQTALRSSRSAGLRASQAMLAGYAAMVNGILIGMSEGLQATGGRPAASAAMADSSPAGPSAAAPRPAPAAKKAARKRARKTAR